MSSPQRTPFGPVGSWLYQPYHRDMIPVVSAVEPTWFDERVRAPGNADLASRPAAPLSSRPPLWRRCLPYMSDVYDDTCAYLGMRINHAIAYSTVDHFIPRATSPALSYEWSNFRLAAVTVNTLKSHNVLLLDPFSIDHGEFELDLLSGEVLPGTTDRPDAVGATINALKLNAAEFVSQRVRYIDDYLSDDLSRDYLERWFPFGAAELARQGY